MDPNRKLVGPQGFPINKELARQPSHFDPRKTGRDQYDPSITYGPNYKPTSKASTGLAKQALAIEKSRFEENKKKKTFKLP